MSSHLRFEINNKYEIKDDLIRSTVLKWICRFISLVTKSSLAYMHASMSIERKRSFGQFLYCIAYDREHVTRSSPLVADWVVAQNLIGSALDSFRSSMDTSARGLHLVFNLFQWPGIATGLGTSEARQMFHLPRLWSRCNWVVAFRSERICKKKNILMQSATLLQMCVTPGYLFGGLECSCL